MTGVQSDESSLIVACQSARGRGDSSAYDESFGRLYRLHLQKLRSIARGMTRSLEDADEVVNDAFRDFDRKILIVDPGQGGFGLLRQFAFRRAAEKYVKALTGLTDSYDPEKHPEPVAPGGTDEDRLVAGVEAEIDSAAADRLAALAFGREAGAPNERMIFLFCRTLGYKPARVVGAGFSVRRLGACVEINGGLLSSLVDELEKQWLESSLLRPERIARLFEPLRADMSVLFCDYPLHGSTRVLYQGCPIWQLPVSDGRLRDYFRSDPATDDIRKWCVNVEKRVVRSALGPRAAITAGREAL